MNWFRLYYEARNDAKLRSLSDAEHRTWFHLLCFSAEQPDRGYIESVTPRDIGVTGVTSRDWRDMVDLLAVQCANNDTDLLVSTVEKLIKLRIVTPCDGGLLFINFDKRQYVKPSDSPQETRRRKAEQRERERGVSRDVTPPSRPVTRPDTDTDTETEVNNPPISPTEDAPKGAGVGLTVMEGGRAKPKPRRATYPAEFDVFWQAYPSGNGSKKQTYAEWKRIRPDAEMVAEIMAGLERWKQCDRWQRGFVKSAHIWLRDEWWTMPTPAPQGESAHRLNDPADAPGLTDDQRYAIRKLERMRTREWMNSVEALRYNGFNGDEHYAEDLIVYGKIAAGEPVPARGVA